jgi:ATP-dependent DNA ligase
MLASPLPPDWAPTEDWIAEEKYDGHRLIVEVREATDLFSAATVAVFARSRDGKARILPHHVYDALRKMPVGTYDGELTVPGERSYNVTERGNQGRLVYVVFDVLRLLHSDLVALKATLAERRAFLEEIFAARERSAVDLVEWHVVRSVEDVHLLALRVWERGGEGLIVKRARGTYAPGKRSKDWLKVKQLRTAVLTVTGFEAGLLGPHAKVTLVDEHGVSTTVKTRNDAARATFAAGAASFVGRRLRIEYQERTPDGSYRHPRWDRWEDE